MVLQTVFWIITALGILAALGTVLARNLVHAALYLVAFFFLVACQFVLLEAEFLAAMQVLVYIGAVAILLMFGIMLTRNILGDETTGGNWLSKLPAAAISLGLLVLLAIGIRSRENFAPGQQPWVELQARPVVDRTDDPRGPAVANMGKAIGNEMMTRWLIPFEVAGLLLTAALIGAVALAQADLKTEAEPHPGAQTAVPTASHDPSAPGSRADSNAPKHTNGDPQTQTTPVSAHA